jgi:hypothetical protein
MTEDEYIAVKNLTRVKIAREILGEILPRDDNTWDILRLLSKLQAKYYKESLK